jgi:hypothetical protein
MSRAVASPLRDVNGAAARRPVRLKRRALSDSSDDDASDEDAFERLFDSCQKIFFRAQRY